MENRIFSDLEPSLKIAILIPALNEEEALPYTLMRLKKRCEEITMMGDSPISWSTPLVIDNGSTDRTAEVARNAGADVISETRRGYGRACLTGIEALSSTLSSTLSSQPPYALLFTDADGSDDLSALADLIAPLDPKLEQNRAELVIGSRVRFAEPGALTPLQRFGNALSCSLIKGAFGAKFTDLGPLRIIRWKTLEMIQMEDQDFGWTVEMQAKIAAGQYPYTEVDVRYLPRYAGESKISGNLIGSYRAGVKILSTIARIWWRNR